MSMNFEEFKDAMVNSIKNRLPEDQKDSEVKVSINHKINETYNALTVHQEGTSISAAVNLDRLFERYEEGADLNSLADQAMDMIQMEKPEFDVSMLMDYESVKDRLFVRASNAELNQEALMNVPHTIVADIAVTYHIMMDDGNDGMASVMVTNQMLNQYGISPEQLAEDAMRSSEAILPVKVQSMADVMREMFCSDMMASGMSPEEAEEMFDMMGVDQTPLTVITNDQKMNGASALFYPDTMDQIAQKLEGDFFILPSSVHEVLALPDDGQQSVQVLKDMVTEINATQVAPNDRLTDQVYHFDAKDRVFERAEDFEQRQSLKTAEKGAEYKHSLRGKLEEKKQEAAEKTAAMPKTDKSRNQAAEL